MLISGLLFLLTKCLMHAHQELEGRVGIEQIIANSNRGFDRF